MKRTLTGTLVAVVAGAAFVAAQAGSNPSQPPSSQSVPQTAPAPSQPGGSQSSSAKTMKQETVTYTGCLETGSAPGTFVLTNVSTTSKDSSRSTSRPTSSSASASATAGDRFLLSGAPSTFNMSTNVNHKVEITGVIADMGSTSSMSPSSSGRTPTEAGQSSAGQSNVGQANAGQSAGQAGHAAGQAGQAGQEGERVVGQQPSASASTSLDAGMRTITVRSAKVLADRCTTF